MTVNSDQTPSTRLLKGTIIYFIGTFISKGMTLLLLPLITIKLTTSEYGYYDLIITITMILMPIFTMQSIEAVFRFLFNADENKRKFLLSSVWVIIFVGIFLFRVTMFIINKYIYTVPYMDYLFFYFVATLFLTMYQRVSRSMGKNIHFAISGIINTVVILVSQLIALLIFSATLNGLIISYVIAAVITCVYLEKATRSLSDFSISAVKLSVITSIIKYGLPLIPNNISWWGVSTVNKLLIISILGADANGIFAITAKFTMLLTVFVDVFRLAWQESAIIAYDNKDKDRFYSEIFDYYIRLLSSGIYILLPLIKILLPLLIAEEYLSASKYIPITMIGAVLAAIVSYYGAGYIAASKTSGAFWTTSFGAVINIIICYLLIGKIGLYAPAIATTTAYLVMWISRHHTMKEYYRININTFSVLKILFFTILTSIIYYYASIAINVAWLLIAIILSIYENRKFITTLYKKCR